MLALWAQQFQGGPRTWGFGEFAIALIIVIAIVAVVFAAARGMGVAIPSWVIHVGWIVLAAFVCIFAIRLLLSM